jgi:RimJ/RimL family protein N-acetyltransferase
MADRSMADPNRSVADPDRWYAMAQLSGRLVRLEPLTTSHEAGYLDAAGNADDAEAVFRWLTPPPGSRARQPLDLADARRHIGSALAARARGERFPYAQFDVESGHLIGTTSLYDVVPALRTLAIGHTWLGRPWWRTGHNTESKLLLLSYAFDDLGAARVVWHTDIHNERSQAAIARIGASREGVLRKHRIRFDGSWRDTVQYSMTDDDWPAARDRLSARLIRGSASPVRDSAV